LLVRDAVSRQVAGAAVALAAVRAREQVSAGRHVVAGTGGHSTQQRRQQVLQERQPLTTVVPARHDVAGC